MRKSALLGLAVALAIGATTVACTSSTRTTETTGAYIDDSAITAKVKTAILNEPGLKSTQIGVETFKSNVQLSGFVDSAEAKARAGQVAANVEGVQAVSNNLIVK